MFHDDEAGRFASELLSRVKVRAEVRQEYEIRIEGLKAKSRRLIDVAYNRALNDVLAAVGDGLSDGAKASIVAMRREVRTA